MVVQGGGQPHRPRQPRRGQGGTDPRRRVVQTDAAPAGLSPLMVQMVASAKETCNLDNTLRHGGAQYEEMADEKTSGAIALIQPVITVVIGWSSWPWRCPW